jgi:DNA-binding CsgD family transcriptional regulator
MGGPRAIDYAARHPDQVERLVLYGTLSRPADVLTPSVLQAFAQLARTNWEVASHALLAAGVRSQDEQAARRWAEMLRKSITGEAMACFMEGHAGEDFTPLLEKIQCPTLVCHGVDDGYIPFALGRRLAELIPGASLLPFEGEAGSVFNDGATTEAIDAFLPRQLPAATPADSSVADARAPALTPRETEILRHLAAGRTSSEISSELSLSIRTVGRHITNIYTKIGARGRSAATSYAIRHGIARE